MGWVQRGRCPLTPFTPLTSGAGFALAPRSHLLWVRLIAPFPSTEHARSRGAEPSCGHLHGWRWVRWTPPPRSPLSLHPCKRARGMAKDPLSTQIIEFHGRKISLLEILPTTTQHRSQAETWPHSRAGCQSLSFLPVLCPRWCFCLQRYLPGWCVMINDFQVPKVWMWE